MPIEISPLFPPATLTQYANRILQELPINDHLGDQLFPRLFTPTDDWSTGIQVNHDFDAEAEYRTWDTEMTVGSRPALFRITGNVAPLSRKIPLIESMIRLMKSAGERNIPQPVIQQVFSDTQRLTRTVQNRVERGRWEAMDLATFSIGDSALAAPFDMENGIQHQIDFLRDGGHRYAVTTLWDAGGTPIDDEISLIETASDIGVTIDRAVMSRRVARILSTHSTYTSAFDSNREFSRLNLEQMNDVREKFGLPRITLYDAKSKRRVSGADVVQRFMPDNRVMYYSSGTTLGNTVWGRSSYVGESGIGAVGSEGGPVVFVSRSLDPLTYYTHIDAVAIPILANANDTYSVEVLSP